MLERIVPEHFEHKKLSGKVLFREALLFIFFGLIATLALVYLDSLWAKAVILIVDIILYIACAKPRVWRGNNIIH